tara:strand:- start:824 stop:925 length:102 start_codon:yes stop_codon:yes gene_type:complete
VYVENAVACAATMTTQVFAGAFVNGMRHPNPFE